MSNLNDVFRNLGNSVGVFWKGRFDRVPASPGVYAWFYPLRINSYNLEDFVGEVHRIQSFDAVCRGEAVANLKHYFAWRTVGLRLKVTPRKFTLPPGVEDSWDRIVQDPDRFERLRRVVLRSTILMPPLYVGKTVNLNVRCQEHIHGTGKGDFHTRFESFAEGVRTPCRRVSDLLFFCVETDEVVPTDDPDRVPLEDVVEEILKFTCNPVYSVK